MIYACLVFVIVHTFKMYFESIKRNETLACKQ